MSPPDWWPAYDSDPWRAGAAEALNKAPEKVTLEERSRFKRAFFCAFHVKAPSILQDTLKDMLELQKLPEVEKYLLERDVRARLAPKGETK
jgi:hypothetical protein